MREVTLFALLSLMRTSQTQPNGKFCDTTFCNGTAMQTSPMPVAMFGKNLRSTSVATAGIVSGKPVTRSLA